MSTNKKQDEMKSQRTNQERVQQDCVGSKSANELHVKLLEETPLLDDEDEGLYNQTYEAVIAEAKPQSFFERIAAKEYADKLLEERRYKTAIVNLIEGARKRTAGFFTEEDQRELDAIEKYLPSLVKFTRMIDNSEASRRSLLKELRRKPSSRKGGTPGAEE